MWPSMAGTCVAMSVGTVGLLLRPALQIDACDMSASAAADHGTRLLERTSARNYQEDNRSTASNRLYC